MTAPPLIARLAEHLQRPVPEHIRTRARLHLLDWLACVAGARTSEVAGIAGAATDDPLRRAALLGGVLEMDDVDRQGRVHPGPVVWPAAMMEARLRQRAIEPILDAGVCGIEATISVARTLDDRHYAHWHPTHTAGRFGAAAVSASVLGLDAQHAAHALAIAGSSAGAVWQVRHEVATSKSFHGADAVFGGLFAADLAAAGMTGPLSVLEGPQGFYAATCHNPNLMVLGPGWRIEEVSFKPFAACRHAHPAIDCALELRAAGRLDAPFHVETYRDALTFCDKPDPTTEAEAKFSLQHAVAVVADGRNAGPADFTLEAIAALAPLRAQVSVAEDPAITARYPAHFGARVNGFELVDTRGDPERPMSEADLITKLRTLVAWGGLADAEAERAAELALRGNDAGAIVAMLEDWLS